MIDLLKEAINSQLEARPPLVPKSLAHLKLKRKTALYVSLAREGRACGCMGGFFEDRPVLGLLTAIARSAAFGDDRFAPVKREELREVQVGLWWGTSFETAGAGISRGQRALMVEQYGKTGVLLPYVRDEKGWDETTLELEAMRKAGIPASDERPKITYFDVKYCGENHRWSTWMTEPSLFFEETT